VTKMRPALELLFVELFIGKLPAIQLHPFDYIGIEDNDINIVFKDCDFIIILASPHEPKYSQNKKQSYTKIRLSIAT